jgi:hypothetical protein
MRMAMLAGAVGAAGRPTIGPRLDVAAHGEDEALGCGGDLGHGCIERSEVARRWRSEATDLAHVLTRGRFDLTGGRGVVLVTEGSDASTHVASVPHDLAPGAEAHRRVARPAVVMSLLFLGREDTRS